MIKFIIIIIWNILFYFFGIFIKKYNFNIFESQLLLTLITITSLFNSSYFMIFDNNHFIITLKNIFSISYSHIFLLYISCLPIYKILALSYIDTDPVIIQLITSNKIIINLIMSIFFNKKIYLINKYIISLIIINLLFTLLPIIFYDNFTLKINNIDYGKFGIILSCISLLSMSIINIFNERLKNNEIFNINDNCYSFILIVFYISDIIFSLLFLSFTFIIEKYYKLNQNIININTFNNILYYSYLFSFIYGPIYNLSTKKYLFCNSIEIGIITNINFIILVSISCLLQYSIFYYLYIPSMILIILSSLIIIYKINKLEEQIFNNIIPVN
jgi:hypothetical protein